MAESSRGVKAWAGLAVLLTVAAIFLEAKVVWEFLRPHGMGREVLVMLHLLACVLITLHLFRCPFLPKRALGWPAFVFAFTFALPAFGMLGILLAVLPALAKPIRRQKQAYGTIAFAHANEFGEDTPFRYGPGGFRARLLSRSIPPSGRLQSLLSIRNRSTPQANRLMRELLKDPADELRLMAYGTLERREVELQREIQEAKSALRSAPEGKEPLPLLRRLAFLHWEVAYQELTEGELSEFYLKQARDYAKQALDADPRDGALWILLGQAQARLGSWNEAAKVLDSALRLGAPEQRVVPRLAELAFLRRDFRETRRLLLSSQEIRQIPALQAVVRFWNAEGSPA